MHGLSCACDFLERCQDVWAHKYFSVKLNDMPTPCLFENLQRECCITFNFPFDLFLSHTIFSGTEIITLNAHVCAQLHYCTLL